METVQLTINMPKAIMRKVNGQEIWFHPEEMHESWLAHCLEYGIGRYVNDKFSGEKGQTKYDLCDGLRRDMESGEAMPQRVAGSGGGGRDPVEALALKNAKADLLAAFKKRTGLGKIVEMCQKDEAVAAFFDGTTWKDDRVTAWMESKAKRDYMAEAKATLEMADEIEVDL